jgi:hypothetical protein
MLRPAITRAEKLSKQINLFMIMGNVHEFNKEKVTQTINSVRLAKQTTQSQNPTALYTFAR